MNNQSWSKRSKLAIKIAALFVAGNSANAVHAADATWAAGAGTAWYTAANWSPAAFPGLQGAAASNNDIATFTSAATATIFGIDGTTASLNLGAITLDATRTTVTSIGNNGATANELRLYGATLGAVSNTILRNQGTGLLTLQATQTGTMGLVLGNTSNVVQITGTGGIAISSIISELTAGSGLTVQGGGTGVLTLSGANTYTGVTNVSTGHSITISNGSSLGTTAGNTVVASGARVFIGTNNLSTAEPFNIAGTGTSANGAIHVGGSATGVVLSGAITLSGNASMQFDGSTGVTMSGGVNLGSNTLTIQQSGTSTFSTVGISGTNGSVIKNTGGTTNFNVANTYTGATTINAGTLSLGNLSALGGNNPGVNGTSGLTLAGGTTLNNNLNSSFTLATPITLGASGTTSTIALSRLTAVTGTQTLNGAIGGAGNLTFSTSASSTGNQVQTFLLGAANNYSGSTRITTGNGANNPVVVRNGVVDALPTTTVLTLDGGAGGGTGRNISYDLNGNNQTLAGLTNITGLTLRRQFVTSATAAELTINNTADFSYGGAVITSGSLTSTQITGAISLTKNGPGTFTLGGPLSGGATAQGNSFTGVTKILGGILVLGETTSIQNSNFDTTASLAGDATNGLRTSVTTLTLGGLTGNKNFADVFTTTTGGYAGLTALTLNPSAAVTNTYSGNVGNGSGNLAFTKSGAGTQVLTGVNTFTGDTTISAGTLTIGGSGQLNSGSYAGNIANAGTLNYSSSANQTLGGVISGLGAVNQNGAGTLTVTGANSYAGNTAVNGGLLQLGNATALGFGGLQTTAVSTTTVNSGFTLDLNGSTGINEPILLSGTGIGGNGALINSSGTPASIGNGIAGLAVAATGSGSGFSTAPIVVISGTGTGATATASLGVTAASFGTPTPTGTITSATAVISGGGGTGATAIIDNAGVITITNAGTGYTSAPTITATVVGGGTITYAASNATNFTVGGLTTSAAGSGYTGTPTVTFDGGAATVSPTLSSVVLAADSSIGGTGDIAISAVVSESGGTRSLTKLGSGILTLSGANTYTGGTTVNAGTLAVNNTTGSGTGTLAVLVNTNGKLAGNGLISGAVNITGGTLSPGNSIDSLDTGTLSFSGGTFAAEINTTANIADLVNVTGDLNITGSPTLTLADLGSNATLPGGTVFTLVDYSGIWNTGTFSGYADNSTFTFGANSYLIDYNNPSFGGTALTLTVQAIPEPSTLVLGGLTLLGFAGAGLRRRRQAKQPA